MQEIGGWLFLIPEKMCCLASTPHLNHQKEVVVYNIAEELANTFTHSVENETKELIVLETVLMQDSHHAFAGY